jgi:hypothetical protein
MIAIAFLFVRMVCDCFKSRRRIKAEILVLRHQLNVLQQRAPRRLYLSWADRALFVWLYREKDGGTLLTYNVEAQIGGKLIASGAKRRTTRN